MHDRLRPARCVRGLAHSIVPYLNESVGRRTPCSDQGGYPHIARAAGQPRPARSSRRSSRCDCSRTSNTTRTTLTLLSTGYVELWLWPRRFDDNAALHALESGSGGERDSAAGVPGRRPQSWQHRGNRADRNSERESVEQVRWRRERGSNAHGANPTGF